MRIIGGKLKGRRFEPPKSFLGRPTTDFAREGLFNVLNSRIELNESKVLDLFSGTGAICYECFSRGAEHIVAVEKDGKALNAINARFEEFEMEQAYTVRADVMSFVMGCPESFDLIFADPPFRTEYGQKLAALIPASPLLEKGGLLVIEHDPRTDLSTLPGFVEIRKYGHVVFSLFRSTRS
jgi:16S rRNA (guanine966-N2)-methyltransferase